VSGGVIEGVRELLSEGVKECEGVSDLPELLKD